MLVVYLLVSLLVSVLLCFLVHLSFPVGSVAL